MKGLYLVSALVFLAGGILIVGIAYGFIFDHAPEYRELAQGWDELAIGWEELGSPEQTAISKGWASLARDQARWSIVQGLFYGTVGIAFTGLGTLRLAMLWKSRRDETKI